MKLIPREQYFRVDKSFNALGLLKSIIAHKYLFIIAIPSMIGFSWYLMRDADFKYNVNASFKVHREFDFPTHALENRLTALQLYAKLANIYNYIGSVDTYSTLYEAIYDLDFDVEYLRNTHNNYGNSPFRIEVNRNGSRISGVHFKVTEVSDEMVHLKSFSTNYSIFDYRWNTTTETRNTPFVLDTILPFGQMLEIPELKIAVHRERPFHESLDKARYAFDLVDASVLAHDYKQRIRVKTLNKGSSILSIAITTAKKEEDSDLLDQMMTVYEGHDLDAKNAMARNTIRFLDGQLKETQAIVAAQEDTLAEVKSKHSMMNLSAHANTLLTHHNTLQEESAEINTQLKYYRYLLGYCQKQTRLDTLLSPSLQGVRDAILVNFVKEHSKLQLERQETLFHAGPKNPKLLRLNAQIEQSYHTIIESISGLIAKAEIELGGKHNRLRSVNSRINSLPALEREIIASNRVINNELGMMKYLKKKKSQAELALASNLPDCEIWETAHIKGNSIVAPLVNLSHLMMMMVGLMIPFVIMLIKGLVSEKITNVESLIQLGEYEVIGIGPSVRKRKLRNFMLDKAKSSISERWQAHALSLKYFAETRRVIGLTATHRKAGTTTAAIHLAKALKNQGSKVVLLNMNPSGKCLFPSSDKSVLTVLDLVRQQASYDDLFTEIYKLKVIQCGDYSNDPSELFESHIFGELMRYLKHDFDYVMIDLPPISETDITRRVTPFVEHLIFSFADKHSEIKEIDSMNKFKAQTGLEHGNSLIMNYVSLEFQLPWKSADWESNKKILLENTRWFLRHPIRSFIDLVRKKAA
ncbi:MAG: tyrosine-protein kinase Etk/Wzc [Litorivivens sp.]|jgi:tyrosine-protein kinase Etk/Wzc